MFLQCDWSPARLILGRLAHNSNSHPIIRFLHLPVLVASQRGDVAALERQEREKLNQEDGACTFSLHASVNLTTELGLEHMFHCSLCAFMSTRSDISCYPTQIWGVLLERCL